MAYCIAGGGGIFLFIIYFSNIQLFSTLNKVKK